jgi:hypothetical protein
MYRWIRLFVAVAAAGALLAEAAAHATGAPLVHPKWRVVRGTEFRYAGASDRYLAVVHGYTGSGQLTLIDEQTGKSQTPSLRNCGNALVSSDQVLFGGPWLLVQCAIEPGDRSGGCGSCAPSYVLYNLDGGQWTESTSPRNAKVSATWSASDAIG